MDGTKPWYESFAIWGGLVAALSGAAGIFGVTISAEDQATLANGLSQTAALAGSVAALGGGALAVWGRIRATTAIARAPAPPDPVK